MSTDSHGCSASNACHFDDKRVLRLLCYLCLVLLVPTQQMSIVNVIPTNECMMHNHQIKLMVHSCHICILIVIYVGTESSLLSLYYP